MINGETGYLSMDVKVPVDKGVRNYPYVQVTGGRGWEMDAVEPQRMWFRCSAFLSIRILLFHHIQNTCAKDIK